jgi:hypothetical protein
MSAMNLSFEPKFSYSEYSEEDTPQESAKKNEFSEQESYNYEQELLEAITETNSDLEKIEQEFVRNDKEESYLKMKRSDEYPIAA